MSRHGTARRGFTLIELAVVLVIIGLIVGSILVGEEMVNQAEIRGTITAMHKYIQAYNTFVTKYSCVPGDCANATSFGFTGLLGGSYNGDGDGRIYSFADGYTLDGGQQANRVETWGALMHLYQAHLIGDKLTADVSQCTWSEGAELYNLSCQTSNIPITNGFMFFSSLRPNSPPAGLVLPPTDTNYLFISMYPQNYYDFNPVAPVLTPMQAYDIDSKIDDGMPMSGSVRATIGYYTCDGQQEGPCYNAPDLRSTSDGYQACVDNTVTPPVYWTAASYMKAASNIYGGTVNLGLCSIDTPVN